MTFASQTTGWTARLALLLRIPAGLDRFGLFAIWREGIGNVINLCTRQSSFKFRVGSRATVSVCSLHGLTAILHKT